MPKYTRIIATGCEGCVFNSNTDGGCIRPSSVLDDLGRCSPDSTNGTGWQYRNIDSISLRDVIYADFETPKLPDAKAGQILTSNTGVRLECIANDYDGCRDCYFDAHRDICDAAEFLNYSGNCGYLHFKEVPSSKLEFKSERKFIL